MNNNTTPRDEYIGNDTKQHLNDSLGLNTTPRRKINKSIEYYKDNLETMKIYGSEYAKSHRTERNEYDRRYYRHRTKYGDCKKRSGDIFVWNLLNISGDIFL
mgnify:FL=1